MAHQVRPPHTDVLLHGSTGVTRRQFIRASAAVAASAAVGPSAFPRATAASIRPLAVRPSARVAVVGVPRAATTDALSHAIRAAALAATDFSWLGRGQRGVIKVLCNSTNPYPAPTHPGAA